MIGYRSIAAALILLAAAGVASEGRAQCVPSGEGQQMVAQGQVLTLPQALQRAGISASQLAGQPQLCRAGGWVYRVPIVQGGQRTTVNIPAS